VTLLGSLLRNHRPDAASHAWNQQNLAAPDTLEVTSLDFEDGGTLGPRHRGRRVGGENVSPRLAWGELPAGTAELLFLMEDLDAPLGSRPPVHCLALIDVAALTAPRELAPGGLGKKSPAQGVTLLRSLISTGYYGPEPLKGHGPHRYVFQLFALGGSLLSRPDRDALVKARPRKLLASVDAPILARGRITGIAER
jgi:phosphatidylethanolamine-binding protein (PEBP) family uncharacterized protein